MANKGELVGLPGFLPEDERPHCRHCRKVMRPHVVTCRNPAVDRSKPLPLNVPWSLPCAVRYGYEGNGRFCTLRSAVATCSRSRPSVA